MTTRLDVAASLRAEDYVVYGTTGEREASVNAGREARADVSSELLGFVFAGPKLASESAEKLASESGLYLSPSLGFGQRVIHDESGYRVSSDGPLTIDATTTLLSLLMMHPDLCHPAADVAKAEAEYFVKRLNSGWPTVSACAKKYDELLSAGSDPTLESTYASCVKASLDEMREGMPNITPALERQESSTQSYVSAVKASTEESPLLAPDREFRSRTARRLAAVRSADSASWSGGGIVVSDLLATKSGDEVELEATTRVGTGLDYLFFMRRLPSGKFPQGKGSTAFASPELMSDASSSSVVEAGVAQARSYFSYIDVIGGVTNWLASELGKGIKIASSGKIGLVVPSAGIDYYELRFFSGGYGLGDQATIGEYALAHYSSETKSAFRHNVASAIVELITLVPGSDALLGEDVLGVVVQEATTAAITGLESLIATKGAGGVSGSDVYDLLYGIAQSSVLKYIDKATEKSQEQGIKKLVKWVGWGGKKAAKLILTIPNKVAKGGSLANRAFRLADPESTMELWYIAVGEEGDLQVLSGSDHVTNPVSPGSCTMSADINWSVKGVQPQNADIDTFYAFSVKGGTSGTVSLTVANADCTPRTWQTTPDTSSYPAYYSVFTVTSVRRAEQACTFTGATYNRVGDPIGDVTRAGDFTENGFEGSFTLPPPAHEADFPHISVNLVYEAKYQIEHYRIISADAAPELIDTQQGQQGTPLYFKTVSVEGR